MERIKQLQEEKKTDPAEKVETDEIENETDSTTVKPLLSRIIRRPKSDVDLTVTRRVVLASDTEEPGIVNL